MDEQKKSSVFSVVVSDNRYKATQLPDHLPHTEKTEARKRDRVCLEAILVSFEDVLMQHPHILDDPAAFYRLAVAHGFPRQAEFKQSRPYETVRQTSIRYLSQQIVYGHELINIWKSISPVSYIRLRSQKPLKDPLSTPVLEPFSPGPIRKIRSELAPIKDQLGFQIIMNLGVLDNPIAFYRLCLKLGYKGPGATHDSIAPNDLSKAVGRRLISAWRLLVIG